MKFDQFYLGQMFMMENLTITKEEIMEFARKYDPQYFHINEGAAKESLYGNIIASGFHTIAIIWSEWIRMNILGTDCLGGLGSDEIIWKHPVYPDDILSGVVTVADKRLMRSGNRGLITLRFTVKNNQEDQVLVFNAKVLVAV